MSLPPVSEKSPLPSIIVTPPTNMVSSHDDSPFYIAFLAPLPKPSIRERVLRLATPLQFKARTAIILLVLVFIMACHVITHRLAACRPRLDLLGCSVGGSPQFAQSAFEWFGILTSQEVEAKRDFIITEMPR